MFCWSKLTRHTWVSFQRFGIYQNESGGIPEFIAEVAISLYPT